MPVNMRRESRSVRRQLIKIERRLSDDDLADWALVHALVQADWYRRTKQRARVRYVVVEAGSLMLGGAATVLAALGAPGWITATVAAALTLLGGLRRVFDWHAEWLAAAEAWSRAAALIAQYRLLDLDERTAERRRELVADIDSLVVEETRSWRRRRRELVRPDTPSAAPA